MNLTKLQKSPFFNSLVNWEKIWKCKLQPFTKYLTPTLVFMWNTYQQNFMFISSNRASFHLPWKKNLEKHPKVSKYYENDCKLIFKKPNFSSFSWIGQDWESPARATLKNPKIALWIGKNVEVKATTNTHKILILSLWMNWESLCPNLSFTAENKIGNMH